MLLPSMCAAWSTFEMSCYLLDEPVQHVRPLLLVGDLPPLEDDGRLHLVPLGQEPPRVSHLEVKIVCIGLRVKPKLLQQGDVLVLLLDFVLLRQLVLVLAEVDDLADGGRGIGNNFHEVGFPLLGQADRGRRRHDAQLSAVLVDDAHFRDANFLVDAGTLLFADGYSS